MTSAMSSAFVASARNLNRLSVASGGSGADGSFMSTPPPSIRTVAATTTSLALPSSSSSTSTAATATTGTAAAVAANIATSSMRKKKRRRTPDVQKRIDEVIVAVKKKLEEVQQPQSSTERDIMLCHVTAQHLFPEKIGPRLTPRPPTRKKKKPKNPKGLNDFLFWSSDRTGAGQRRKIMRDEFPRCDNNDISQLLGILWEVTPDMEKADWCARAKADWAECNVIKANESIHVKSQVFDVDVTGVQTLDSSVNHMRVIWLNMQITALDEHENGQRSRREGTRCDGSDAKKQKMAKENRELESTEDTKMAVYMSHAHSLFETLIAHLNTFPVRCSNSPQNNIARGPVVPQMSRPQMRQLHPQAQSRNMLSNPTQPLGPSGSSQVFPTNATNATVRPSINGLLQRDAQRRDMHLMGIHTPHPLPNTMPTVAMVHTPQQGFYPRTPTMVGGGGFGAYATVPNRIRQPNTAPNPSEFVNLRRAPPGTLPTH